MRKFYSENIVERIRDFITRNGWRYKFDERKGIFIFGMEAKVRAKKIDYVDYMIKVGKGEYMIYVILPLLADVKNERMMSVLAEFICRINYGLEKGSFEINMKDGIIQFKYYINCMNITPPKDIVEHSITWPLNISGRYMSGFVNIIEGNYNIREVMESCEMAFLEEILTECRTKIYDESDKEDDYFFDEDEDINLDFDDDNIYYDDDNLDHFLDWCVSQCKTEKTEFEVNMDLFGLEEDDE